MQVPLVLTVIGPDRPGLVEGLAAIIAQEGGNWLESRMCRLGGEFAGILRIHIGSEREETLRRQFEALQTRGLSIVVRPGGSGPEALAGMAELELVGQDRPGIVHEIAAALARQGVNVEELATECGSAPMSGESLFKARARLHIPASCRLAELRKELERIGGNLLVDVGLEEVKSK
jgi:glycine cleavage system regulatory protein